MEREEARNQGGEEGSRGWEEEMRNGGRGSERSGMDKGGKGWRAEENGDEISGGLSRD